MDDVCSRERDDNDFGGVVLGGCGPKESDCVLEEWRMTIAATVAATISGPGAIFFCFVVVVVVVVVVVLLLELLLLKLKYVIFSPLGLFASSTQVPQGRTRDSVNPNENDVWYLSMLCGAKMIGS